MINNEKLDQIKKLVNNQNVKNITYEGQMTIIEFENGEILPLYGGVAAVDTKQKISSCSFCGKTGTVEKPVVSLNENDDPLICSSCAVQAIKTLVESGIEVELDITNLVSPKTIEKLLDKKPIE